MLATVWDRGSVLLADLWRPQALASRGTGLNGEINPYQTQERYNLEDLIPMEFTQMIRHELMPG